MGNTLRLHFPLGDGFPFQKLPSSQKFQCNKIVTSTWPSYTWLLPLLRSWPIASQVWMLCTDKNLRDPWNFKALYKGKVTRGFRGRSPKGSPCFRHQGQARRCTACVSDRCGPQSSSCWLVRFSNLETCQVLNTNSGRREEWISHSTVLMGDMHCTREEGSTIRNTNIVFII